jgi:hypothetical protein
MRLFRPVGLEELRLIYEADMRAFPPRLPEQPIFYPVTNEAYAVQIARDWNTKSGTTKAGFVTMFSIADIESAKLAGVDPAKYLRAAAKAALDDREPPLPREFATVSTVA